MFIGRRRPLARAAMVGGTAYVAGRAGQRAAYRQQQEYEQESDQEARLAALEAQQTAAQAPPPPAAAAAPPATDVVSRITELSKLHQAGALTDEEFAAAKQQILAG